MPVYVFRCARCDHEFRELLWPSETIAAVRCPECQGDDVEKQLAPFAVGARDSSPAEPFCGRCGQNRPPCDS